jgi:SAM-dependent methyltransferase
MNAMRPFVDYYSQHNISPVAQDISDLERHFERRGSLYRSLRIPPLYIRDRDVIEFGPGSGYNALYTQSLGPRRYLMVEANPRGLDETRALLGKSYPNARNFEVVQSLIEEFDSPERFDLVLAEGLVPFQRDPAAFIRHISRWAKPGGLLVLTCADAPTIMGEVGRRLIAYRLAGKDILDSERVKTLAPVFAPHLQTLAGMSRSVEDWIYDNVLIPFVGRTFGIDEAIGALGLDFEIYGSSPEFMVDLRWYKQLYGAERAFNERAADAYHRNMLNFLDYRIAVQAHDAAMGIAIAERCRRLYTMMQAIEESAGQREAAEAAPLIREIARLAESSPRTARALSELADVLEIEPLGNPNDRLDEFVSYFGRGMQYLSLVRRV